MRARWRSRTLSFLRPKFRLTVFDKFAFRKNKTDKRLVFPAILKLFSPPVFLAENRWVLLVWLSIRRRGAILVFLFRRTPDWDLGRLREYGSGFRNFARSARQTCLRDPCRLGVFIKNAHKLKYIKLKTQSESFTRLLLMEYTLTYMRIIYSLDFNDVSRGVFPVCVCLCVYVCIFLGVWLCVLEFRLCVCVASLQSSVTPLWFRGKINIFYFLCLQVNIPVIAISVFQILWSYRQCF